MSAEPAEQTAFRRPAYDKHVGTGFSQGRPHKVADLIRFDISLCLVTQPIEHVSDSFSSRAIQPLPKIRGEVLAVDRDDL